MTHIRSKQLISAECRDRQANTGVNFRIFAENPANYRFALGDGPLKQDSKPPNYNVAERNQCRSSKGSSGHNLESYDLRSECPKEIVCTAPNGRG